MFPVSIKGILLSPNREVVLLLNELNDWELPGGRIDLGESSTECLAREIREELDLEVRVTTLIDTYLFEIVPDQHIFIVTYFCKLVSDFQPLSSNEHKEIGLFELKNLPKNLPVGYRRSIMSIIDVR